jgi:hypothetical protein
MLDSNECLVFNGHAPKGSQRTNNTANQLNTTAEQAIMLVGKKSTKALQAQANTVLGHALFVAQYLQ